MSPAFRTIALLALVPMIGMGFARFAYALLVPAMQADLGIGYGTIGWLNSANAAGYLAGALAAPWLIQRWGLGAAIVGGTLATALGLVASGLVRDVATLSLLRGFVGSTAAVAFIAGGAQAAIAAGQNGRLLSLFYIGPGFGIAITGASVPLVLEGTGDAGWALCWIAMGVVGVAAALALGPVTRRGGAFVAADRRPKGSFRLRVAAPVLIAYGLFGAGYIGYMTFLFAWSRQAGASPILASGLWVGLGVTATLAPWLWGPAIQRLKGGRAIGLLTAVCAIAAAVPLASASAVALMLSAVLFGSTFVSVVAATTVFVQRVSTEADYARGIGLFTIIFGIGQTLGPGLTGWVSDVTGSLDAALIASAVLLGLATLAALTQSEPRIVHMERNASASD